VLLSNASAFVTGGGSGIGRAIAIILAENDARVAVVDINEEAAQSVAEQVCKAGGEATAIHTDVSCPMSVRDAVKATVAAFGGIDVLVNNAGICPLRAFEGITLEEWNQVLAVNLTGVFICTQAVLPYLRRSRQGRIINIGSMAGRTGGILAPAHYAASKAGMIGLTKILAGTEAQYGVTVNCIAPGTTETPLTAGWDPQLRERILKQVPLRRLGKPEDVASAVLYLASDGASWVTGATFDINGGLAMI
jgi:3-oxoacyl-[acyl-carrier protein] reductase